MNREIKFRAWDGVKFYTPILEGLGVYRTWRDFEDDIECDDPLMQYTGLKDKGGVEIYEGDIIRVGVDSFIGKILFDSSALCWSVEVYRKGVKVELMTLGRFIFSRERAVRGKVEVIGNIYENRELLGEVND